MVQSHAKQLMVEIKNLRLGHGHAVAVAVAVAVAGARQGDLRGGSL